MAATHEPTQLMCSTAGQGSNLQTPEQRVGQTWLQGLRRIITGLVLFDLVLMDIFEIFLNLFSTFCRVGHRVAMSVCVCLCVSQKL